MKPILFILILVSTSLVSSAQKRNSLVAGTWRAVSYYHSGDSLDSAAFQITFNADGTYSSITNGEKEEGKYRLKRKVFKLYHCGLEERCNAYFGVMYFFGTTKRKLIKDREGCQLVVPMHVDIECQPTPKLVCCVRVDA